MTKMPVRLFLLLFLFAGAACRADVPLPEATLRLAGHAIRAEVASTPETRSRGLMQRQALAPDRGMLFIFPSDEHQAMWMVNTPLPLSVAFLDRDGRVINVADMEPLSEDIHASTRPARYALEMNRGWFARHGVGPGARLEGIPRLAPR